MDYQLKTILIDEMETRDIQALLEDLPDLELKEVIHRQEKAIEKIKQVKPDVIVLNIPTGEDQHFDLASRLTAVFQIWFLLSQVRILLLRP